MKTVIEVAGATPSRTRGTKNKLVGSFKEIVEAAVTAAGGTITNFNVSAGVISVEVEGDEALKTVTSMLKEAGLEATSLSLLQAHVKKVAAAEKALAAAAAKKAAKEAAK